MWLFTKLQNILYYINSIIALLLAYLVQLFIAFGVIICRERSANWSEIWNFMHITWFLTQINIYNLIETICSISPKLCLLKLTKIFTKAVRYIYFYRENIRSMHENNIHLLSLTLNSLRNSNEKMQQSFRLNLHLNAP